jgi:Transposase IS116/IS110/IS902 family
VDMFGPGGTAQLDALELPMAYSCRLESLRDLIAIYDPEVLGLDRRIAARLVDDAGYRAIQALDGVGPALGAVFVAEIGDVSRFTSAERLCSWAGMTPRHRESDTKVHRGSITKQSSRLLRWAAVEAVSKNHAGGDIKAAYRRIAERRGRNIARVAAARKLLTLVYYRVNANGLGSTAGHEPSSCGLSPHLGLRRAGSAVGSVCSSRSLGLLRPRDATGFGVVRSSSRRARRRLARRRRRCDSGAGRPG